MSIIKRGEIYYIDKSVNSTEYGSEQQAGRPAIVVSNEKNNENSSVFEVVYLTTQQNQNLSTHVVIKSAKRISIALCEQITSVSEDRFGDYIGKCSEIEMQQIDAALAISLSIDCWGGSNAEHKEVITLNDAFVRCQTERDVYKRLYEQMLERMVKV